MLSDDLTRTQSELYAEWRRTELASPLPRLWALVCGIGRGARAGDQDRAEPLGQLEHLPGAGGEPDARVRLPAA